MSHTTPFNGQTYSVPDPGDLESTNWGANLTAYFDAIAAGTLQKTGGSFTLTAETNFGSSFGLAAVSFRTTNTNPATSGTLRLNNTDHIDWRNNGNTANLPLTVNASDRLQFNGIELVDLSSTQTLTNKTISGLSVGGMTANRAIISDGSGVLTASSVTSTEVGHLAGVTSPIQTQINAHLTNLSNPHSVTINQVSPLITKGDLLVRDATNSIRLGVGSNGQVLTADSAQASGVKWAANIGIPGGSDTQVQFSDAGAFGGDADFTWNKTTNTLAIAGVIRNADGDSSAPSYSFSASSNMGIYRSNANELSFATGGTQAVKIDSSGNLVLVSSLLRASANGSISTPDYSFANDTDTGMYRVDVNALGFVTAGADRMVINPSGVVGIGTGNPNVGVPDTKLQVHGGGILTTGGIGFYDSGDTDPDMVITKGGTGFCILRNFVEDYTILDIWAKPGALGSGDREATLALVRGNEPNQEFIDLYNNGYAAGETQFGLRIQKRGTGEFRDFVVDQSDGVTKTEIIRFKTDRTVAISQAGTINNSPITTLSSRNSPPAFI